jgi:hypothetical protein
VPIETWLHERLGAEHGHIDGFSYALRGRVWMAELRDLNVVTEDNSRAVRRGVHGAHHLTQGAGGQGFERVHVVVDEAHRALESDPDNLAAMATYRQLEAQKLEILGKEVIKEPEKSCRPGCGMHVEYAEGGRRDRCIIHGGATLSPEAMQKIKPVMSQLHALRWHANLAKIRTLITQSKATILFTATPMPGGSPDFSTWWGQDQLWVHTMFKHCLLPTYEFKPREVNTEEMRAMQVKALEPQPEIVRLAVQYSRGLPGIQGTIGEDFDHLDELDDVGFVLRVGGLAVPDKDRQHTLEQVCRSDSLFEKYQPFARGIETILEELGSDKVVTILAPAEFSSLQFRYGQGSRRAAVFYSSDENRRFSNVLGIKARDTGDWLRLAVAHKPPLHLFLEVSPSDTRLLEGLDLKTFTHLVLVEGLSDPKTLHQAIGRVRRLCDEQWLKADVPRVVIPVFDLSADKSVCKGFRAREDDMEAAIKRMGRVLGADSTHTCELEHGERVAALLASEPRKRVPSNGWGTVLTALGHTFPEVTVRDRFGREEKAAREDIRSQVSTILNGEHGWTVEELARSVEELARSGLRSEDRFILATRMREQGEEWSHENSRRVLLVRVKLGTWCAVYTGSKVAVWRDRTLYTNKEVMDPMKFDVVCVLRKKAPHKRGTGKKAQGRPTPRKRVQGEKAEGNKAQGYRARGQKGNNARRTAIEARRRK